MTRLTVSPFFMIFEAFQIFYISINFIRLKPLNWNLVMFFYHPVSLAMLILSYLIFSVALIFLMITLCFKLIGNKAFTLILLIFFYYSWSCYLYFWNFQGILGYLNKGLITNSPTTTNFTDSQFFSTSLCQLIVSAIAIMIIV